MWMSELWDLKHTSEQPNCNVANISLRFEGEILEIAMFTFFVLYQDQLLKLAIEQPITGMFLLNYVNKRWQPLMLGRPNSAKA